METTKKVIEGRGLDCLLVSRLLLLCTAGLSIVIFHIALNGGVSNRILLSALSGAGFISVAALLFLWGSWCVFVVQIWHGLFPERKLLPYIFCFSFLPLIGPLILVPLALLIPARRREGRAFLWNLMLVLLLATLQIQLIALIATNFYCQAQAPNLIFATVFLLIAVGFPAYRQLAGRRIGPVSGRICIFLLLVLGTEYVYSVWEVRNADAHYAEVAARLESLHVPFGNAGRMDFYRDGIAFSDGEDRLRSLYESVRNPVLPFSGEPDEKAAFESLKSIFPELDKLTKNDLPYKSSTMETGAGLKAIHFFAAWTDYRILEAARAGDAAAVLSLIKSRTNLLRTLADNCSARSFSLYARNCRLFAEKTFPAVLSALPKPFYRDQIRSLDRMFQEQEYSLRNAAGRAMIAETSSADAVSARECSPRFDLPNTALSSFNKFYLKSPLPTDFSVSRFSLGAPFYDAFASDRVQMCETAAAVLSAAPWTLEPQEYSNSDVYKLLNSKDPSFIFPSSRQLSVKFQTTLEQLHSALSAVRAARGALEKPAGK